MQGGSRAGHLEEVTIRPLLRKSSLLAREHNPIGAVGLTLTTYFSLMILALMCVWGDLHTHIGTSAVGRH